MRDLTAPKPIPEVSGLDRTTFDSQVRVEGHPLIIRGLAAEWPAVAAARESAAGLVAYLKGFATARPATAAVGQPEINGRFFYKDDLGSLNFERGKSPLTPFLERLLRDAEHPRPLAMAIQSEPIPELLPGFELANRIDLVPAGTVPRAWIGNRIRVGTHSDLMENIGVVVAGRRRFTLFAPDQVANLYLGPFELTPAGTPVSMVDLAEPDFERYPRFRSALANAQVAELGPGDAIYIPYHWWHAVESLEAVNLFVNYWWNEAGRQAASPYHALMLALLAIKTLPQSQREVWRMLLDHYIFDANGDPAEHIPPHARGMLGELDLKQKDELRSTLAAIFSR